MDTTSHFAAYLRSLGNMEGMSATSFSSIVLYLVGFLSVVFFFRRNDKELKAADMDGVPMQKLDISSAAALLIQPHQISKRGQDLAADEPYIVRDGEHSQVVIHAAEHVREFLRNDAKDHTKPADLNFGDYFYRLLGQCVGALYGPEWRSVRDCFDPAYTHDASLKMLPLFQDEVVKWLKNIKNDSLRGGVLRATFHAPTACGTLPLRVIPPSFYGGAFDDSAYNKMVSIMQTQKQALKYIVMGRWQKYSWFNRLPTASKKQLDRYHDEWKSFNVEILETARKNQMTIPAQHVYQGVVDGTMTMENYLQTIDEMIFTNIDITGRVLSFMLDSLARHQDFQQRLHDEISAEKKSEAFDMATYVARQDTLLHYLCLESVRLQPAVWFSVPECASIDKIIGRYKIPAGSPFIIDVGRLNTNALTWGADGSQFRPERFATMNSNSYRYGYMRYGVVSGKCLGKRMADVLMKTAVVSILETYRVDEVELHNLGVKQGDLAIVTRE